MSDVKNKARSLRSDGESLSLISKQLGIPKSTVSKWTRDIILSPDQIQKLLHRSVSEERKLEQSLKFQKQRKFYQDIGRDRCRSNDALYVAGCMLYWGEGEKSINSVTIINSEIAMLILFKKFLQTYFDVLNSEFRVTINCYTDVHNISEIEKYWLDGLGLNKDNLRKGQTNNAPKSSKNTKSGKLEYGTCTLKLGRTDIVQEIYGAIQEFAGFSKPEWLRKNSA